MISIKLSLLTVLLILQACAVAPERQCSDHWQVTGYYTPVESDYQGKKVSIKVTNEKTTSFTQAFIEDVKIEGWGKTRSGWYLGYYSNKWHKSQWPLDSTGKRLIQGTAATDPLVITTGSSFTIASKANHLNTTKFVAHDVGSKIKGRHIDIYTGEGRAAQKRTYPITGKHSVCIYNTH